MELLGCVSESVLESSAWESAEALSEPCFPGPFPHPHRTDLPDGRTCAGQRGGTGTAAYSVFALFLVGVKLGVFLPRNQPFVIGTAIDYLFYLERVRVFMHGFHFYRVCRFLRVRPLDVVGGLERPPVS